MRIPVVALKTLGVVTTAGMFLVLIMGSAVTNTGSEQGCGRSWPLCHGQLIPQMAVSTAIEFSHRAVVGVETILILAFALAALLRYWERLEMRVLVMLMVLFLFLQAGLGAWAVMYPQVAAILALHFGVSLICFAAVLLATVLVFEADGSETVRDRAIPGGLRRVIWALALYSYVVVYLGAYVRHAKADDACSGWPLCNGAVIPTLEDGVLAAFSHRIAALVLTLSILTLVWWTRGLRERRPDLYRGALLALGAVLLQALSGAVVAWTDTDLFSALGHAASAGLLFGALTYLCLHTLSRAVAVDSASDRRPATMPAASTRS